jgi:hypothetical protein
VLIVKVDRLALELFLVTSCECLEAHAMDVLFRPQQQPRQFEDQRHTNTALVYPGFSARSGKLEVGDIRPAAVERPPLFD